MFKRKIVKLHRFCRFSHKLRTKRSFFSESLDILSLMWYNIIRKSVKLLDLDKVTLPHSKTRLQDTA